MNDIDISSAHTLSSKLCHSLSTVIRGREDTIKLVIAALLADGHVLLEDYPGSGKTTLTKTLGRLVTRENHSKVAEHILNFRRVQFTPDMLPGDVLGVSVFEPKTGQFRFIHGPVFAHVLLADEINRTGPKVQAAFLECMAEKQVTIDNVTHKLDDLFFVVGTQNPLDVAGTYPLPLVQLDRFLFRIPMTYVNAEIEAQILSDHEQIARAVQEIQPVCTREEILNARALVSQVYVHPLIRETIVQITQATRGNPLLQFGASTRAALMIQSAAKSWAVLEGRNYVNEDDLKTILPYVLLHRLKFHAGAGSPEEALYELALPHFEELARSGLK